MSIASELLALVPAGIELIKLLRNGDAEGAERQAKAIAQSLMLKKTTRAAAKAAKKITK